MSSVNEETADVMLTVINVCLKPDDDDASQSKNKSLVSKARDIQYDKMSMLMMAMQSLMYDV